MKILYTTNQLQKWDNIFFEHFPQNSKLTLVCAHCAYCIIGDQEHGRPGEYGKEKIFKKFVQQYLLIWNYVCILVVGKKKKIKKNFLKLFILTNIHSWKGTIKFHGILAMLPVFRIIYHSCSWRSPAHLHFWNLKSKKRPWKKVWKFGRSPPHLLPKRECNLDPL